MMKWRQILIAGIAVAAVASGLFWAFRPQPVGVDLAEVQRGRLVVTVDDKGLVRIRDTYDISTPIGGDVQRIPFSVGDLVQKGEVVATVVPQLSGFLDERSRAEAEAGVRTAEAGVAAARTEVSSAGTELAYWEREADRVNVLLDRGLTTQKAAEATWFQRDSRKLQLANAKAALDMRERQLEQARAALLEPGADSAGAASYNISAPIDGQVLAIANESQRSLPAGAQLLTIGDPRDLEIVADLLSTDAVKVKAGAAATVDDWGGGATLQARVRRIEPIGFTKVSALGIEEQRVRVHLDILGNPETWQSLGHLYSVFVHIETKAVDDVPMVPVAALFRDDSSWAVFADAGGIARLRHISLGARNDSMAEIRDGLDAGARVLLHPNDQIADGTAISDRGADS